MSEFIAAENTGRGFFRADLDLVSQGDNVRFEVTVSNPETWVAYMFNLSLVALDNLAGEPSVSADVVRGWQRASAVALCLWANESTWGEAQWWGNMAGFQCTERTAFCMRFTRGDRTLRAFVRTEAEAQSEGEARAAAMHEANFRAVKSFWMTIAEGDLYAATMPDYRAGKLVAVTRTQRAGWGPVLPRDELVQIYRRVYEVLNSDAAIRGQLLTPDQAIAGWTDGRAPATRGSSSYGSGLYWAAVGVAVALYAGSRK